MDLEQKLEGPWAWGFAVIICLLIVGAMFVGARFNHPMAPPPVEAESAGIAATQGAAPTSASAAPSGVPSGNEPKAAGGRGSAGTAVHAGTAKVGPGNISAPSTGVPNPAAGAGSGTR